MLPISTILARLVVRARIAADIMTQTSEHDGVLWCSLIISPSKPTSSARTYSSK